MVSQERNALHKGSALFSLAELGIIFDKSLISHYRPVFHTDKVRCLIMNLPFVYSFSLRDSAFHPSTYVYLDSIFLLTPMFCNVIIPLCYVSQLHGASESNFIFLFILLWPSLFHLTFYSRELTLFLISTQSKYLYLLKLS